MDDEVQAIARKARWKWLRKLTWVLWIAFALCAAMLFGGFAMLDNGLDYRSVYMALFNVGSLLAIAVLFTGPASVLIHVAALATRRTDTRTGYLGIFSAVVIGLGGLAVLNYALPRFGV